MMDDHFQDNEFYVDFPEVAEPCGAPDPDHDPEADWFRTMTTMRVGRRLSILVLGHKRFPDLNTPARILSSIVAFAYRQNPDVELTLMVCLEGGALLLKVLASWSVIQLLEELDAAYANLDFEVTADPFDPQPDLVLYFSILAFQQQRIAKIAHDARVAGVPVHVFGWDGYRTVGSLIGP